MSAARGNQDKGTAGLGVMIAGLLLLFISGSYIMLCIVEKYLGVGSTIGVPVVGVGLIMIGVVMAREEAERRNREKIGGRYNLTETKVDSGLCVGCAVDCSTGKQKAREQGVDCEDFRPKEPEVDGLCDTCERVCPGEVMSHRRPGTECEGYKPKKFCTCKDPIIYNPGDKICETCGGELGKKMEV